MADSKPCRVAIIGGGCAALTTAFELTRPEHGGRYAVTVYQMGWRLGGKGASGRGASGRIEEHGLHLWMGFYENAFRPMRECYAELGRDPVRCPIATWQDAFQPAPVVAVMDRLGTRRNEQATFEAWIAHFPTTGTGLPGDARAESQPYSVRSYLQQAIALALELLRSADASARVARRAGDPGATTADGLGTLIERLLGLGQVAGAAFVAEAMDLVARALGFLRPSTSPPGTLFRLLDAISAAARRQLGMVVGASGELRRVWLVVDLILAILRGALRCGLLTEPRGFDAINDHDWREWLGQHGATAASLDSAFVRGIYDLVFAFPDGDLGRPRLAAGVALRGAMRMFFTYRGSLFWRMSAGMGDVVFAPLFEVLRRRGVQFEFFHQLRNMRLSPPDPRERPHVSALELDVQARVRGGRPYEPLVEVGGVPSWPARPDYSQLENGEALEREARAFEAPWDTRAAARKVLHVGQDFDLVVLGVGLAAIPLVAPELVAREPRWQAMVEHGKTVATRALQLWLSEDMEALGWPHPPVNLSGYTGRFDTWADMTHLVPVERHQTPVKAIAYFCSVLPERTPAVVDAAYEHAARRRVRDEAIAFLEEDIATLWLAAVDGTGQFRWKTLVSDETGDASKVGSARIDTQFYNANVNPSERYSLSVPGSIRHRVSPLELHFDNLTVAGDWTRSGLDSGCVEPAVMSGLLAAHALSGSPPLGRIAGYDHP